MGNDHLVAFLRSLHVDSSILPVAPDDDHGTAITRRTQDEVHPCIVCGERARVALIITNGTQGLRWLDACPRHGSELRKANELPPSEGFGVMDEPG